MSGVILYIELARRQYMTRTEKIAALKQICQKAEKISFSKVDTLITADVIKEIFRLKTPKLSLRKLSSFLQQKDKFAFFLGIFQLRSTLPETELLKLWYLFQTERVPEYSAETVETDELLLDNRDICKIYCQQEKPGWQRLRYIVGRKRIKAQIPDKMREALAADDAGYFNIFREMTGKRLSYSLLYEIIVNKAVNIFRYLLQNGVIDRELMGFDELAVCFAAGFEDSISVMFLQIMEESFPQRVQSIRDHWGRNLLWYASANRNTAFFHPFCKLTPFLLECGCSTENRNQLDISWGNMLRNLKYKQKEQMLKARYSSYTLWKRFHLVREQPIYALADKNFTPEWLKNLL